MGRVNWDTGEFDMTLPTNVSLFAEGYSYNDFKSWKQYFSYAGPYVRESAIPVQCKCEQGFTCYKHRMEGLRRIYAKPLRSSEIIAGMNE